MISSSTELLLDLSLLESSKLVQKANDIQNTTWYTNQCEKVATFLPLTLQVHNFPYHVLHVHGSNLRCLSHIVGMCTIHIHVHVHVALAPIMTAHWHHCWSISLCYYSSSNINLRYICTAFFYGFLNFELVNFSKSTLFRSYNYSFNYSFMCTYSS